MLKQFYPDGMGLLQDETPAPSTGHKSSLSALMAMNMMQIICHGLHTYQLSN